MLTQIFFFDVWINNKTMQPMFTLIFFFFLQYSVKKLIIQYLYHTFKL